MVKDDHIIQLVATIKTLGYSLNTKEIAHLRDIATFKIFKKNDIITKPDVIETHVYFILDGISLYFENHDKAQRIAHNISFKNDFISVFESYTTKTPTNKSLQALTQLVTLQFSFEDLLNRFQDNTTFSHVSRTIVENKYLKALERTNDLVTLDAKERYTKLLKKSPKDIDTIPQNVLSSYLGIQPQSLSRIKKIL